MSQNRPRERQDQQTLFPESKRTAAGITTSDVVLSAYICGNAEVFREVMSLHVPVGAKVADVTWGQGVFWQKIPPQAYDLTASDIATGVDCRSLPYEAGSFDCVVFDPPYMEGLFRRATGHLAGSGSHSAFRQAYSNGQATTEEGPKYHAAVVDLYAKGAREAYRVLRHEGIFIVKCQDEVSANRQWLTHVEIINDCEKLGYYVRDLFIVMRTNRPAVTRLLKQVHARKNHSYFIVFQKTTTRNKTPALPGQVVSRRKVRSEQERNGTGAQVNSPSTESG